MKSSPFAPDTYPTLPPLAGVTLATCNAGIRYQGREDALLMRFAEGAQVAGVYTRSLTAAAPVQWCRAACDDGGIDALFVNSGNANAFTGAQGMQDVHIITQAVGALYGGEATNVMMSSTGVIGEFLPVSSITNALSGLHEQLSENTWEAAASAIMTTDTFPKMATRTAVIDGVEVTLNGIAKGSGMIAPDMATMLGYIVTDASLPASILQILLGRHNQKTFNCITVDGDTSTNDTVLLIATNATTHTAPDDAGDPLLDDFKRALRDIMQELATLIIKDGEGTSKFVTINVTGAEDDEAARLIGLSIGNSPLVKTALAAQDPNWGRIVMAVGNSGCWIDQDKLRISIGDVAITDGGAVRTDYVEADAAKIMQQPYVTITVDVGVGEGRATIWTSDLTEGYIRINADYRS